MAFSLRQSVVNQSSNESEAQAVNLYKAILKAFNDFCQLLPITIELSCPDGRRIPCSFDSDHNLPI